MIAEKRDRLMKVERQPARRKQLSCARFGCGAVAVAILGIMVALALGWLVLPQVQNLFLANFGLESMGETDDLFDAPIQATAILNDPRPVDSVRIDSGSYSQTFDDANSPYYEVVVGSAGVDDIQQMQVSFTEDGLYQQCLAIADICAPQGNGLRNARFDLRPNGLIIHGEFQLQENTWQRAGLVVQVVERNRLDIVGIDINGSLFTANNPELANLLNEAETRSNALISQLVAQAGGTRYTLQQIIIDSDTLTFILR